MDKFNEFIEKDIEVKKNLISALPVKTKTNKRSFNSKISDIEEKYIEYKDSMKHYLLAKSRSFEIHESSKVNTKLNDRLVSLERIKYLLNPLNTYVEKMGLDVLLYKLKNYYTFNFSSLETIIKELLEKFKMAGIILTKDDFDYTCYVNEYMTAFLNYVNTGDENYDHLNEVFEKIYWVNSEIVEHIELNFKVLVRRYEKNFNAYIARIQKEAMELNEIVNYADCIDKINALYIELNIANKEKITDIITMAKTGAVDINHYLEDSKIRKDAFDTLLSSYKDIDHKSQKRVYYELNKLKFSILEYENYLKFLPIINYFAENYKELKNVDKKTLTNKKLKDVEASISAKENELKKINRKIFTKKISLFDFKNENVIKELKVESIKIAKEIYLLYKEYDKEYFNEKVYRILDESLTVTDVLNLYYSFDYYKKGALKNVFKVTDYEELLKLSETFDLFAMDPTNVICNGIFIFEEADVAKIIVNKYVKNNINITIDDLSEDNLYLLASKVNLLLRLNIIENSRTTVEKIWFMTKVEKLMEKED